MLTEETFELFKNSYNFRNRYIVEINDKIPTHSNIELGVWVTTQRSNYKNNKLYSPINLNELRINKLIKKIFKMSNTK